MEALRTNTLSSRWFLTCNRLSVYLGEHAVVVCRLHVRLSNCTQLFEAVCWDGSAEGFVRQVSKANGGKKKRLLCSSAISQDSLQVSAKRMRMKRTSGSQTMGLYCLCGHLSSSYNSKIQHKLLLGAVLCQRLSHLMLAPSAQRDADSARHQAPSKEPSLPVRTTDRILLMVHSNPEIILHCFQCVVI